MFTLASVRTHRFRLYPTLAALPLSVVSACTDPALAGHSPGHAGDSAQAGAQADGRQESANFIPMGGAGSQATRSEAQIALEEDLRGSWEREEPLPPDERPPAPDWELPSFVSESRSETLCLPFEIAPEWVGFHADDRGLFAAVARSCSGPLRTSSPCDRVEGSAVYQFTEAGWEVLALPSYRLGRMTAAANGPLFFGPNVALDPAAGVQIVTDPFFAEDGESSSSLLAAGSRAYLVASESPMGGPGTRLAEFRDGAWISQVTSGGSYWPIGGDDAGALYLTGPDDLLAGVPPDFQALSIASASSLQIVGHSTENFWVIADGRNIRHYEHRMLIGSHEREISRVALGTSRLWALNSTEFGYFTSEGWVSLATLDASSGQQFQEITAVSDDELYLTMSDAALAATKCGGTIVLKYNGTTFARI